MWKKIKQWFCGFAFCLLGLAVCAVGIDMVFSFMEMINVTGMKCIGYLIRFVFMLLLFIFMPYIVFKEIEDGVQDRWK